LSGCYVVVDVTRGLCGEDVQFVNRYLTSLIKQRDMVQKYGVDIHNPAPINILLTKCDLISDSTLLGNACCAVENDMKELILKHQSQISSNQGQEDQEKNENNNPSPFFSVHPVSAFNGLGIKEIWREMMKIGSHMSYPTSNPREVKHHVLYSPKRQKLEKKFSSSKTNKQTPVM